MKWKTSISTHKDEEIYVRGVPLKKLMSEETFAGAAFLLLAGRQPEGKERELFEAILTSCVEHGIEAPSAFTPRVIVSTGNSLNAAVAGGVLAIGDFHGGAIEECARLLQSERSAEEIVSEKLSAKERIPGYGHKVYKDKDPRAELLLTKAGALGLTGQAVKKSLKIKEELKAQSGKELPLNIDGAIAALISDLGFDWRLGKGVFILGRMPGMIAHAHEEMLREKPYRRLEESEVEYDGPVPQ